MLYLLKRLKTQLQGGTREITKVAQTFSEIGIHNIHVHYKCVHVYILVTALHGCAVTIMLDVH